MAERHGVELTDFALFVAIAVGKLATRARLGSVLVAGLISLLYLGLNQGA